MSTRYWWFVDAETGQIERASAIGGQEGRAPTTAPYHLVTEHSGRTIDDAEPGVTLFTSEAAAALRALDVLARNRREHVPHGR